MSRMIRSSRLFASVSRRGFSSTSHQRLFDRLRLWPFERKPEPVSYRMQIVKPQYQGLKAFRRRFVRFFVFASVLYYILPISVEISTEDDAKEDIKGAQVDGEEAEEEEEEYDEDDSGLFIPLSWPVEVERTYYRGSDPEWQDYMKFAKDKESQKRAQEAVVMLCRQAFIDVPQLAKSIGAVDVTKGKYWLDVDFPLGPPPDYEQIGIEFGSSFVALAAQTLSQQDYNELCRIFDPSAIAHSAGMTIYASFKFLYHCARALLKHGRNADMNPGPKDPDHHADPQDLSGPRLPWASRPTSSGESSKKPPADMPAQQDEQDAQDTRHPGMTERGNVSHKLIRDMFAIPFSKGQREVAPPRGSIVLGGLVECHGTNYVATIDVTACWDLTEEQIVMHNAKVRHITPRRIAPHRPSRMPPHGSPGPPPPRAPSI